MTIKISQHSFIVFLSFLALLQLQSTQQQTNVVCGGDCVDVKPPNTGNDCQFIANVLKMCGTPLTAGDTFCKCSCNKCPGQIPMKKAATQLQGKEGWHFIDTPVVQNRRKLTQLRATDAIASIAEFYDKNSSQLYASTTPAVASSKPSYSVISALGSALGSAMTPALSLSYIPTASSSLSYSGSMMGSDSLSMPSASQAFTPSAQTFTPTSTVTAPSFSQPAQAAPTNPSMSSNTIGLAVGGQNGIDTFRKSVEQEELPSISDLTFEGIFNDYYFDIESKTKCTAVFCGKYSGAISSDPLSDDKDFKHYYLAVGLDSGQKASNFKRRDLDLVVVLDVSGSMSDRFGDTEDMSASDRGMSKLDVAKQAINKMMEQLNENDAFSLVTFERTASVVLDLKSVTAGYRYTVETTLRDSVRASGNTNLEAGLEQAADLMQRDSRENRIIVISDANINEGEVSAKGLANIINDFAEERDDPIYTSLIGVGLDFNTTLTDTLVKTKGANYFTVYSPAQLRKKLEDEFEYMVTPFIFDLKLELNESSVTGSNGWYMAGVYGVAETNAGMRDGKILEVTTLFPSSRNEDGIKGGIILIEVLPMTPQPQPLIIRLQYTDQFDFHYDFMDTVTLFDDPNIDFFGTEAVQKGVLLTRYVNLLHQWLRDVTGSDVAMDVPSGTKLDVPKSFARQFIKFADIMREYNEELNDESLDREIEILDTLGLYGLNN